MVFGTPKATTQDEARRHWRPPRIRLPCPLPARAATPQQPRCSWVSRAPSRNTIRHSSRNGPGSATHRRLTNPIERALILEHSRNIGVGPNAPPLCRAYRGPRAGRFRQGRLHRLPPCRAADAGGIAEGRTKPHGQGPRPEGAAALSGLREEGAGGGFDQVGAQ